jgi:hypothetical protein
MKVIKINDNILTIIKAKYLSKKIKIDKRSIDELNKVNINHIKKIVDQNTTNINNMTDLFS